MGTDIQIVLTSESGIPEDNTIEVNQTKSKNVFNLRQAQSGNTTNAKVAYSPGAVGSVMTTGKNAGLMTVAYGTSIGTVNTERYQITDSRNISAYTIQHGGEVVFSGPGKTKQSPVNITAGTNNIKWRSLDEAVAEVDENTGAITSVNKGAAIVIGEFTDKWGVKRDIHILVGVGVQLGDSDLSQLLELIAQGENIMALNPNPYTTESLENLQTAIGNGKNTVDSASPSDEDVQNAIKGLEDALAAMNNKPTRPDGVIGPDGSGQYYRPLGDPPNVFEIVDQNGDPASQPPEYIYNPGGDPTNGGNRPADPYNGFYYVEDPDGSNIWKPVGKDGSLTDSPALWGGPDGKPGGGDDKPVTLLSDNNYWVSVGQNVWQQVKTPLTLGELTGGGPDENPVSTPALPIAEYGGKYYVGPLGSDDEGGEYYYGDKITGGNGKVMSTPDKMDATDEKFYLVNGQMSTQRPAKPIVDTPDNVDGRILAGSLTGDGDWVEIACNGDYSLIVRKTFIDTYSKTSHLGDADWNSVSYADNATPGVIYSKSRLQKVINAWFDPSFNDSRFNSNKLDINARLRNFTVQNDAASNTGAQDDTSSGLSKPQGTLDSTSSDVPFPLSFGEAVNFCSVTYYPSGTSGADAKANFIKLNVPEAFWLRTLGNINTTGSQPRGTTCSVSEAGYVFQSATTPWGISNSADECLVYPALWVHQDVFDSDFNAPGLTR
ncbi:MAG: hypothetical protein LBH95_01225 [Oscillospiraceae bacterium]|jgi:hypothetical protein|nr:hypothetical protein [Oscillospiraceae bacterium]